MGSGESSASKKGARRSQGPCRSRRRHVCAKKGPPQPRALPIASPPRVRKKGPPQPRALPIASPPRVRKKGPAAAKGLADRVAATCAQKRARRSQGPCRSRCRHVCAKKGPPQLVGLRRAGRNRALRPWVVASAMGECLRGRPHLLGMNPLRGSDATVPCLSDQCLEDPFFADRLVSLGQLPPSLAAGRRRSEAPSMVGGDRNDRSPVVRSAAALAGAAVEASVARAVAHGDGTAHAARRGITHGGRRLSIECVGHHLRTG